MSSVMNTSENDDGTMQTLLIWLNQPDDRAGCRFLETHPALLRQESEGILNGLIEETFQDKAQSLHNHLQLLHDARLRGGSVFAIREAYVDLVPF